MAAEIPAFIPQFAGLLQGTDYDMAVSESVSDTNEFTSHPIEDPTRSFLIDHNRENPSEISISIFVSSTPCAGPVQEGIDRIVALEDALLALRARQAVDPGAMIKIFTGVRIYENMAIRSLHRSREPDSPNVMQIEIDFFEMRFARAPRSIADDNLLDANDGQRDSRNRPLVEKRDRPITEATRERQAPRTAFPAKSQDAMIAMSLAQLVPSERAALGISATGVA